MGISLSASRAIRLKRLAAAANRVALPATLRGDVQDDAEDAEGGAPDRDLPLSGAEDSEGDADVSDAGGEDDDDEQGSGGEDGENGPGDGEGEGGGSGSEAVLGSDEEGKSGETPTSVAWCTHTLPSVMWHVCSTAARVLTVSSGLPP